MKAGKKNKTASAGSEPPPGYQPPRHITPERSETTPPSGHRSYLLPLVSVGSRKFEELCHDIIARRFPEVVRSSLKRISGVEQFGVDVEGFDQDGDSIVVISAKCYEEIKAWDFKPWINDFLDHIDGHWLDKGVKHFVLAVTHSCNDDDMNAKAKALVLELKQRGIQFHLWNSKIISDAISDDIRLVDRYFDKYWVDNISAAAGPNRERAETFSSSPIVTSPPAVADMLQRFVNESMAPLRQQLQVAVIDRLEAALIDLRRGRPSALRDWIALTKQDHEGWSALPTETRAKALRAFAMIHLRAEDTTTARTLLDEADGLSPASDTTARLLLLRSEQGSSVALSSIAVPQSVREREIKAGLLIEAGDAPSALALLSSPLEGSVSPEILRLRAVAQFLLKNRDRALRDAESAADRAPSEAYPRLTLGIIRFFASLAPGVEPQFGEVPNPISSGLFNDTKKNRALLEQAIADFASLATSVEEPLKGEIEIWKLAGLLLHPERRQDAEGFAEALLRRPDPDPMVVAWAANFGILRQKGRIKKLLGDAIRTGRGTPTHLIVLALISAGKSRPDRAVRLLCRYSSLFPEANDLFQSWRAQFGDPAATDANGFGPAAHASLQGKTHDALVEILKSPISTVEQLLAGSEILAYRKAWGELNSISERILSVGTSRAVQLAALAALKGGQPADCLRIIENSVDLFDDQRLPGNFIYMRISANESLGQHRPIIADLISLRRDGKDPHIGLRLMDAYLRIGKIEAFRAEAELALDNDQLDPAQALHVAQTLSSFEPATARRALSIAAEKGITPALAGPAMAVASELGMAEVQSEMMRLITSLGAKGSKSVIRFDNVDDVLKFLEERSKEYKEAFGSWLKGHSPAAISMRSDIKAFTYLFLGEVEQRVNQVGDRFPMLLLSGARRSPPAEAPDDRPILRLDLSALLLASRLDVLPALEQGYQIQVPRSAADALRDISAKLQSVNEELVADVDNVLRAGRSSVLIVGSIPEGTPSVESGEDPRTLDGTIVRPLLEQAYMRGHIGRDQADKAIEQLGEVSTDLAGEIASVALSPFSLVRLAYLGLIEPLARSTKLLMSDADAVRVRSDLTANAHESKVRAAVVRLLSVLADKLESGAWTTMPLPDTVNLQRMEKLEPHLRCLAETLESQNSSLERMWVEDRYISHSGVQSNVSIFDVLSYLKEKKLLTAEAHEKKRDLLRSYGYAFEKIEIHKVITEIDCCHVDESGLIETPKLGSFRAWFNNNITLLSHIDPDLSVNENGRISGEVPRMMSFIGLARELLTEIWSKPEAPVDLKRARSDWVWRCLRLEQSSSLPSFGKDEITRGHISITLAHTLDVPLLSRLSSDASDWHEEFVDWFMQSAILPMTKAEPILREQITTTIASMIDRLLDRDPGLEDKKLVDALHRKLIQISTEFVDLLPENWNREITSHGDLHGKLELKTVMVLKLEDSNDVPIASLAEAYASGSKSMSEHAPALVDIEINNGDAAQLEVSVSNDGLPSATLVVGASKKPLGYVTRALLHPEETIRAQALLEYDGFSRLDEIVGEAELRSVASLSQVEMRFPAFDLLVEKDLHRAFSHLKQRAALRQSISLDELDLPPPSHLAAFLGFDIEADLSVDQIVRDSFANLKAKHPRAEVFRRLCAIPAAIFDATPIETCEEDSAADLLPNAKVESPLLAFLRLRASHAAGVANETLKSSMEAFLNACRLQLKLFIAFVRHASIQAARSDSWMALPPETRLALIWLHADQLTQALAHPGSDAGSLADWVRKTTFYDQTDRRRHSELPAWERRCAVDLDNEVFLASAASTLMRAGILGKLDDETIDLLKSAAGAQSAESWLPFLDVVTPPPPGPGTFWIAEDPVEPFVTAGWLAAEHPFAARNHTELATRILDQGNNPGQPFILPAVLSVVDFKQVDRDLLPRIRDVLDETNGEVSLEPEQGGVHRIFSVRAAVEAYEDRIAAFHDALRRQAKRCAAKWPEPLRFEANVGPAAPALSILVNASHEHACALDRDAVGQMAAFAESIEVIVDGWPQSFRSAIGILDSLVKQLDTRTASGIWPVLLNLRSRQ